MSRWSWSWTRSRGRAVAAALGLSAVSALAAGCGGTSEAAKSTGEPVLRAVTVDVAPLERRPVERTVEVVGTLRGWEQVTVGTKRTGRVARVAHDMGDRVKPDELLVALETVDAALAVEQARRRLEAELAKLGLKEMPGAEFDISKVPSVVQAQIGLERVRLNLARERSLIQRGAGTAQDYQNAENDERGAVAAMENAVLTARATLASAMAAKVALDVARQALVDMEIHAPVPSAAPSGSDKPVTYAMSRRSVSEGQMIREGDAVAELIVEDPLRLWTNVPERFSDEVALGQTVRLRVAAYPDRVFEGTVARINPSVDPVSRTFQVETAVPNPDGLLRPGGFAKASILTKLDDEAVTVPIESIVREAGVTKLFVVEAPQGQAKPSVRAVEVETVLEGKGWVEVRGTLPAEAMVVTSGQKQLADGSPIVVRQPDTDDPAKAKAEAAGPAASEKAAG